VTDARATGELPGGAPQVYDPAVPAADSELTLALLTLGYSVPGPRQCQVETGVTTTWLDAFGQRLRRKQAALTALIRYVPTAITWRYWARQFVTQAGALVAAVSIAGVACVRILPATAQVHPMWLLASALCAVPQLCTAGERGPLRFLLAVTVVVEMLFAALVEAKPSAKGRCTR
jgi:hypothetical protein